ncbi:MAG: DEAD/DEAH box helicase family protein [Halioglobus sp.]
MNPLTTIAELEPIYFANEHDMDREVFVPILESASSIRCMSGYFTSGALSELAVSLSRFLAAKDKPLKFIISPNLEKDDLAALKAAQACGDNLFPLLFSNYELTEDNLRSRAVKSLAYLVATGRLLLKLGLQRQGLFHTKCWIFETDMGAISIHGSVNATRSGLSINTEQIGLNKEWESEGDKRVVEKIRETFESIWNGEYEQVETLEVNDETMEYLSKVYEENGEVDDWSSYLNEKMLEEFGPIEKDSKKSRLKIPTWLNYQSGEYAHQGQAVDSWLEQGKGILSVATGGGKTLTSLVAASKVSSREESLMIVVAVPTKALLNQWSEDIQAFSVMPLNTYGRQKSEIRRELKGQIRRLRLGVSHNEVIVLTHEALKSELIDILEKSSADIPLMLIGDEVHNLGSKGFRENAKDCFKYMLGLSATHIRQFDEEGTDFLTNYFGDVVYEFPLEKAIGTCLVPYDYHVHRVQLEEEEQEKWSEITEKIRKLSYAAELSDGNSEKERWKLLCLQRRRIVESAAGKVIRLAGILPAEKKNIRRTLFFCTDKNPEQLESLNDLLSRRGVNFHQVTAEETSSPKILSRVITSFGSGELQVLTSKRVLDEGFNIPQTETAYFLASNTVRRQWVQRLGRVLRLSPGTGKEKAVVHDFVVIPQLDAGKVDPDLKSLLRGEFERMSFFSKLSSNGLESDGSIELMNEMLGLLETDK